MNIMDIMYNEIRTNHIQVNSIRVNESTQQQQRYGIADIEELPTVTWMKWRQNSIVKSMSIPSW